MALEAALDVKQHRLQLTTFLLWVGVLTFTVQRPARLQLRLWLWTHSNNQTRDGRMLLQEYHTQPDQILFELLDYLQYYPGAYLGIRMPK